MIIFAERAGDRYLTGRTRRALVRAEMEPIEEEPGTEVALGERLLACPGPVWLVRAGAWPVSRPSLPPPSATGRPLCALGLVCPAPAGATDLASRWARLHAFTGGDFALPRELAGMLPPVLSVYLEPPPLRAVAERLLRRLSLTEAIRAELQGDAVRVVRHAPLDIHFDPALRVVQVITSLQIGGAERLTCLLAEALASQGVRAALATLSRPTRAALPAPPGVVDFSALAADPPRRIRELANFCVHFGADLVHAHLIDGLDAARILEQGLPLAMTIHNQRPGWPARLEEVPRGSCLLGCAWAVTEELRASGLPGPLRTAWNGLDFSALAGRPGVLKEAGAWRSRLGFAGDDFVLLSLANPRPQKRLDLLPAILAATRAELARRGSDQQARLILAGQAAENAEALACVQAFEDAVAGLGLGEHIRRTGSVSPVAPLLHAVDVLVNCSRHEGLSLAMLEALAAGKPVVASEVGGVRELAQGNPAVRTVPADAGPEEYARILADLAETPPAPGAAAAALHYSQARLAERHAFLYPRIIELARGRQGDGVLLVTNNFSTGGAQSSARRLLLGLKSRGIRSRAAVLEEVPNVPTPGREALLRAGVPVQALPQAGTLDPAVAVSLLLEALDGDPPRAVLLWNVQPAYKVLIADGLLDVPIFDVSPGEMFFDSLLGYFQRPRPGLPYRQPRDYGRLLAGIVVKYAAEQARAADLGCPVQVIPNGVPVEELPTRTRPPGGPLIVGTLARISPQKRLDELIEALKSVQRQMPPFVLRIAGNPEPGSGDHVEKLKALAEGLPVEWVGGMDNPSNFLDGLDLFALVSEPAGCPNASLEAMARGLPVVATDAGGASEQVVDGSTGRLTPRHAPAALGQAILELALDPEKRQRLGAAGRQRVQQHFRLERMIEAYTRLLGL